MINRIREIRRQKGLTLADVAARCQPPTTAQTIGRLETGTRSLSLKWMNRIGAALAIDPELLVRAADDTQAEVIARLTPAGTEPIATPVPAPCPTRSMATKALSRSASRPAPETGARATRSGCDASMARKSAAPSIAMCWPRAPVAVLPLAA
jgi:transcriptional regulator with XRE-family HTH domain